MLALALAAVSMLSLSSKGQTSALPPATREIKLGLFSMNYEKADLDDKGKGDEPYLACYAVGGQLIAGSGFSSNHIETIVMKRVGPPGPDNVAKGYDWAKPGRRYALGGFDLTAQVPLNRTTAILFVTALFDHDDCAPQQILHNLVYEFENRVRSYFETVRSGPGTEANLLTLAEPPFGISIDEQRLQALAQVRNGNADDYAGYRAIAVVSKASSPGVHHADDVVLVFESGARSPVPTVGNARFALDFPGRSHFNRVEDLSYKGKCTLQGFVRTSR